MDLSMRMVFVAGVLTLALLVAIVGMVSADTITWEPPSVAAATIVGAQPL